MPNIIKRTYKQKRPKKELGYKKSKNWDEFYQSRLWYTLRSWYITEHPLCENCLKYNINTQATEVHHRKPFRLGITKDEKWKLFSDPNNLMSLCSSCHHRIHNKINETGEIVYEVLPEKLDLYDKL